MLEIKASEVLTFEDLQESLLKHYYFDKDKDYLLDICLAVILSIECNNPVWLMIQAWIMGKVFTTGISVTHGWYGIVFGDIHIKSSTCGGINNHGYGHNPIADLRNSVLLNLTYSI